MRDITWRHYEQEMRVRGACIGRRECICFDLWRVCRATEASWILVKAVVSALDLLFQVQALTTLSMRPTISELKGQLGDSILAIPEQDVV